MSLLLQMLAALTLRQKLTIAAAAAAVAASIYFGVGWNRERDLRPLFTNLAPEDAGAVVDRLRAANISYKVGDNGSVLVPSAQVAELRLAMASAGLPRAGRIGFELFDKANLGATDFAEHVNFRRALEGELERSVMALSEVERARVHVTFAKESVFLDNRQPAKASVMVQLRPGASLTSQNVLAITHLTASAVESLSPDSVSVVDMAGNLLNRPRAQPDEESGASGAMLEYRQSLEKDSLAKIRATLDPLLGPDKYRAGVFVDCDFTSGEQSEERFDPERSVMVNAQKTEDVSGSAASAGVPGTASNLPRPLPKTPGSAGGVARRTENIAYQTSRTVRHMKLPQGSIKRLSVSVLVDHSLHWEGSGARAKRVLEPPRPETLKVVRDVVAGVVGFQQERGDQILVETLPFEATLQAAPPGASPGSSSSPGADHPAWLKKILAPLLRIAPPPVWIAAAACILAVLLVALVWVLRVVRRKPKPGSLDATGALPRASAPGALPGSQGPSLQEKMQAQLAQNDADRQRMEVEILNSLKLPTATKKSEVLKKHISDESRKDPVAVAQLVRTWLNEQER